MNKESRDPRNRKKKQGTRKQVTEITKELGNQIPMEPTKPNTQRAQELGNEGSMELETYRTHKIKKPEAGQGYRQ